MAEKTPDEIMAEYLLKGAWMLSRGCPVCGSPLFEIKGETRCVVCAEKSQKPARPSEPARPQGAPAEHPVPQELTSLSEELSRTILLLCRKVQEEPDPERCLLLMEAIGEGIEALKRLTQ